MALTQYTNIPTGTVTSGGTTAPAAGTVEAWTVTAATAFPVASAVATLPTQFHVCDPAANSEQILVTSSPGGTGAGQSWSVTRGAEGTTPVSHSAGFTIYQVVTAGDLGQIARVDYLNAVTLFGADPTGSADSSTAINAAISASGTAGIPAYLPTGTYKHSGTLNLTNGQSLIGDGSQATTLNYTGSTIGIKIDITGGFTGAQYAGRLQGFYINGFSGGATTVGIQAGDLQGVRMSDIVVEGFNTAGIHFLNASGDYCEQNNIEARVEVCGTTSSNTTGCVVFDNSSWDYSNFDFLLIPNAGAHGMLLINNAQLQGCNIRIRGNFTGATPNTGAVIAIDPANSAPSSFDTYIKNSFLDVAAETAGSGTGHYLLYMGSTHAASQFFATGVLNLSSVGPTSQGISNANFLPFGFHGITGDQAQGGIYSFGNNYVISTNGSPTSDGALTVSPYQRFMGLYDAGSANTYGICTTVSGFPSGATGWGGFFSGMGILGLTSGTNVPTMGIRAHGQSSYGVGNISFTVRDNNKVESFNNVLDDGSGNVTAAAAISTSGLTGATAASRYVGATASGAPGSGTFAKGDFVIDQTGQIWVCTTAGSPGTFTGVGGSGTFLPLAGGTMTGGEVLAAGTTSRIPLQFQSGTNLTSATAGAAEYDGASYYFTNETISGRGLVLVEQKFRLTAAGSNITTIANFFGTTSNISLVSGGEYEIEIDCWFTQNSLGGTVTWTFTNTAAPTSMNLEYKFSPAGGLVSSPASTALFGEQYNLTSTAPTVVSTTLSPGQQHHHKFWIRLINGTGTSLKIQATSSAGSITPGINSAWKCRRVPAANVGTFAA